MMGVIDDLPDVPPGAGLLVVGILVVLWILWRGRILRRLEANRGEGAPPVTASLTRPVLFLLLALLVAALVLLLGA